jgi:hypothetical protein
MLKMRRYSEFCSKIIKTYLFGYKLFVHVPKAIGTDKNRFPLCSGGTSLDAIYRFWQLRFRSFDNITFFVLLMFLNH